MIIITTNRKQHNISICLAYLITLNSQMYRLWHSKQAGDNFWWSRHGKRNELRPHKLNYILKKKKKIRVRKKYSLKLLVKLKRFKFFSTLWLTGKYCRKIFIFNLCATTWLNDHNTRTFAHIQRKKISIFLSLVSYESVLNQWSLSKEKKRKKIQI